jgi:hypothetical protein
LIIPSLNNASFTESDAAPVPASVSSVTVADELVMSENECEEIYNREMTSSQISSSSLDSYVNRINKSEIEKLSQLFAEAIYSSGTPFAFSENPYIKNCSLGYSNMIPTRKEFSGKRLNIANKIMYQIH